MLESLNRFTINLAAGARQRKNRAELLLTYLRLKLKQQIATKLIKADLPQESIFGFKVKLLDYSNFVAMFEEIFVRNEYFFKAQRENPTIIDCGSNIGMAIFYFKKLYPKCKILAFEPDPRLFDILKHNVRENRFTDVELHNFALQGRSGEIDFYCDPNAPGSLVGSTFAERSPKTSIKVRAGVLSSYLHGEVDFLKMDIEGAEFQVLEEIAEKQKLQHIRNMMIEVHHHIRPDQDKLCRILEILEQSGFGYQINARYDTSYGKGSFQDIAVHAYQKPLALGEENKDTSPFIRKNPGEENRDVSLSSPVR